MWRREIFANLIDLQLFTLDSSRQDLLVHMRQACESFGASLPHGGVLVHCVHNIPRSSAFVMAYLMREERRSLTEGLADMRQKRRSVKPSENFLAQLEVMGSGGIQYMGRGEQEGAESVMCRITEGEGIDC